MGKTQLPINARSSDKFDAKRQPQSAHFVVDEFPVKSTSLAPLPRGGATLTRMGENRVFLIGGANREAMSYGDIHELHLETCEWKQITPVKGSLSPRSGHSAIAIQHLIVVFGGLNAKEQVVFNDLHVFDTERHIWTKINAVEGDPAPAPRNSHAAILLQDVQHQDGLVTYSMLVFGGSCPDNGPFNDVFVLHITLVDDKSAFAPISFRWQRMECVGEAPEPRELHVGTFVSGDSKTICFSGGRNIDGGVCSDLALLKVHKASYEWELVPLAGADWNRCSHVAGNIWNDATATWETWSFGGWDGKSGILNDVWKLTQFEGMVWVQAQLRSESNQHQLLPAPRFGHCSCVIPSAAIQTTGESLSSSQQHPEPGDHEHLAVTGRSLLVFGGMNIEQDLNDLIQISPCYN